MKWKTFFIGTFFLFTSVKGEFKFPNSDLYNGPRNLRNNINNEEHIKVCMLNAKYTRAMYLYIIRNYYNIYSFQRSIQNFMNVTLKQGDILRDQCKDRIDDDTHSKKDKKYKSYTIKTDI